jgi:hypothetical protein
MRLGRLILVVATIATIMVFPLLMHEALAALKLPSAYAAPNMFDNGGRVYQNGNNGDDDDGDDDDDSDNNDESDNEGEENENDSVECYLNLNDNEPVPCDFDDNENDDGYVPPASEAAPAPPSGSSGGGGSGATASRCFSSSETGNVFLDAPDYDVTVTVVNALGAGTQLGLRALDPATVPAPPTGSTLLDAAVWQIDAMAGCGGSSINQFPAAVNLGFAYTVSANKSKLQIVRLENGAWVELPTVPDPDPNKSYISATIQNAGTYAVIQKP